MLMFVVVLFRTYSLKVDNSDVELVQKVHVPADAKERLVEAISIRTVSFERERAFASNQQNGCFDNRGFLVGVKGSMPRPIN